MGKKKNTTKELTHEEIWDDSALVRSWDEAVEEYKLYHSIHAKGENVEDVLRDAEATDAADSVQNEGLDYGEDVDISAGDMEPPMAVDEESARPPEDVRETPQAHVLRAASSTAQPPQEAERRATEPSSGAATAMPHALVGEVQDESLKNLMIAWYYAGYYTGLHEGQRANQRAT